jgi:hypothetical protein
MAAQQQTGGDGQQQTDENLQRQAGFDCFHVVTSFFEFLDRILFRLQR